MIQLGTHPSDRPNRREEFHIPMHGQTGASKRRKRRRISKTARREVRQALKRAAE